jgi:hypothetical protein
MAKKHKTAAELAARIEREVKTVEERNWPTFFEISFFRQIRQVKRLNRTFLK